MSFKSDLSTYVKAQSDIVAVVSTRSFAGQAPEGTKFPYIVYNIISSEGTQHMLAPSGQATHTIQFDVWAKSDEDREAGAEAIRNAFDGLRGTMGASTEVRRAILVNQLETEQNPTDGTEIPDYRTVLDVDFIINRSVPTFP